MLGLNSDLPFIYETIIDVVLKKDYARGDEFMKLTILPKTYSGKLAVILEIISIILFVVGSVLPSKLGYSGIDIIRNNPLQAIITVMIFAVGIGAAILGLTAVIKKKERSIIVFIVILTGLYNILSLVGVVIQVFLS